MASWRFGIVPFSDGRMLALGTGTAISFARKDQQGNWTIDANGSAVPGAAWGWDASFYESTRIPKDRIYANIWASTITAKFGFAGVLLTFPTTLKSDGGATLGHGYRLFSFEPSTNRFTEGRVVAPAKSDPDNVVMHLAAVDAGSGPALLHWTDIDSASRTATIRGRLVGLSGPIAADFDIAREAGSSANWNLDQVSSAYWYGDYHTGSGFHVRQSDSGAASRAPCTGCITDSYKFYPMWVQPDGTVRYTEVVYRRITPPPVVSEDPKPGPQPDQSLAGPRSRLRCGRSGAQRCSNRPRRTRGRSRADERAPARSRRARGDRGVRRTCARTSFGAARATIAGLGIRHLVRSVQQGGVAAPPPPEMQRYSDKYNSDFVWGQPHCSRLSGAF